MTTPNGIPKMPLNSAELVYAALGHTLDQAEANGGRIPLHVAQAMRKVCSAYDRDRSKILTREGIPPGAVEIYTKTAQNRVKNWTGQQAKADPETPEDPLDFERWAEELADDADA